MLMPLSQRLENVLIVLLNYGASDGICPSSVLHVANKY